MTIRFKHLTPFAIILIFMSGFFMFRQTVQAQSAANTVRAVLFFSQTCPHCEDVMNEVLPPLVEQYPDQLEIVGIDVGHDVGIEMYDKMFVDFNLPENRYGVPTLVVGSDVLVGTVEIEIKFPEIIRSGLAAGGINWPAIDGLAEILSAQNEPLQSISAISTPEPALPAETQSGLKNRFMQDPIANALAVVVLTAMLAAAGYALFSYLRGSEHKMFHFPNWTIPLLAVIGMAVSIYLSYVEISHTEAICGPVGNCNTVQQSSYARLFGVLPIGILGIAGYAVVLITWFLNKFGPVKIKTASTLLLWGMGWFGLLFSIYLTFLEPFVIGASCAWCLTSAVVMALIFLASTEKAKQILE